MMNILLTNDDGIHAKGIRTLAKALSEIANVYVVAPETQRSACGHGISIHSTILVREEEFEHAIKAWSISGTPADCVKLGIRELVDSVDLVVSGTNLGANLGNDCFYSGTVSAAAEAVFSDYPAVAVSICSHKPENYEPSMKFAKKVITKVSDEGLPPGTMLNVNLPDLPEEGINGVRVTRMGRVKYDENFKHGKSSFGDSFYWYNGIPIRLNQRPDSDIQAIRDGYISVSLIKFDLTDFENMNRIKEWELTY